MKKEFSGHSRSRKRSNFDNQFVIERSQIIFQNDSLDIDSTKKVSSRSFKVTQGQRSLKAAKKVKLLFV